MSSDRSTDDPYHRVHRPFRPRAARVVSLVVAVVFVLSLVAIGVVIPAVAELTTAWVDRLVLAVIGAFGVWMLVRQAGVRADPDEDGITVRNLIYTRRVSWPEVVSVRFGQGRPWVQLDLADGGTLAVMAVQRADGARAVAEARRLATLVAYHSATSADD
jgi:hypothetical protein